MTFSHKNKINSKIKIHTKNILKNFHDNAYAYSRIRPIVLLIILNFRINSSNIYQIFLFLAKNKNKFNCKKKMKSGFEKNLKKIIEKMLIGVTTGTLLVYDEKLC